MPIYMNVLDKKGGKQLATGTGTGKYLGWVELDSCHLGFNRSARDLAGKSSDREASAPALNEIVVTKQQDSASTDLFKLSLRGQSMFVAIDFVKSGGGNFETYLHLELENTLISSFSSSGHGGASHGRPMETLSLNFTKVEFKTLAAPDKTASGTSRATWELAAGTSN